MYINTHNMPMKSRNDALSSLSVSDADQHLSFSPYYFESPPTPQPPTPYWGSYGVSATPTSNAPVANASTPQPNQQHPRSNPSTNFQRSQSFTSAPILMTPDPSNLRPRTHSQDNVNQQRHLPSQHFQQLPQSQTMQPLQIKMSPTTSTHHMPSSSTLATQHQQHYSPHPSSLPHPHPHYNTMSPNKRAAPPPSLPPKRRRRSAPPPEAQRPLTVDELSNEDRVLLHLREIKDEEKWDWKELTERFNKETGGRHNLAALQMRHTRLVERMRVWTGVEVCYDLIL
jgi:hypothetical protein